LQMLITFTPSFISLLRAGLKIKKPLR